MFTDPLAIAPPKLEARSLLNVKTCQWHPSFEIDANSLLPLKPLPKALE
jgi:hypothetical protein